MTTPTRLLVARHGDAEYPVHGVLTDDGGWLTETGRAQATGLAAALGERGITAVCTSRMERAVQTGAVAASVLAVPARAVDGLQEYAVGDLEGVPYGDPRAQQVFDAWVAGDLDATMPGGESGVQVLERMREALDRIADDHPGETVLVFSHGGVMSMVIPRLSENVRDDLAAARFLPNCVPAEVEVSRERWRVVSWPGSMDKSTV
ncbi:histidine phosphatase family protein [Luteipulveratus sp. YIM 133132]|uniref:Histidine phosphatase family protein n=1 Tax=Luteipulveratus flavus TaxID=3031728 RepID=A0ABT6C6Q0_9MICO|nr:MULTISPECIES: histidine phosphatase family protein [unclassified Luteipulveratus]MDE9365044.1 histidine phosphatase family protein [Luteipulveratus sp. YIM 133132]MDF8264616.1 histidine phosphatase family protein [Luteipulveratus sp. YIM 133296]